MKYTAEQLQKVIEREITVFLWGRDTAKLADDSSPLKSELSGAIAEALVRLNVNVDAARA